MRSCISVFLACCAIWFEGCGDNKSKSPESQKSESLSSGLRANSGTRSSSVLDVDPPAAEPSLDDVVKGMSYKDRCEMLTEVISNYADAVGYQTQYYPGFAKVKDMDKKSLVKSLLDSKVNPNMRSGMSYQRPIIFHAISKKEEEISLLLIERNADPNIYDTNARETPLFCAVEAGMHSVVKAILVKKVYGKLNELQGDDHRTPLMEASVKCDTPIMELLIDHKAEVNKKTTPAHGSTALDYALGSKDPRCPEYIAKLKAHGGQLAS